MALLELWKNKLRTFLSLFGVTIGIFCIIGVLATVNSLEQNIQNEVKSLGSNTIFVDKWDYSGGPGYAWWKYVNRPTPKYYEVKQIRERTPGAKFVGFKISINGDAVYEDKTVSGINIYGINEEFSEIQPIQIIYGRFLLESDFSTGTPVAVIGNEVAEKLFGNIEYAVGKQITVKERKLTIAGVIKKQGKTLIGGWQYDQSVFTSYRYAQIGRAHV